MKTQKRRKMFLNPKIGSRRYKKNLKRQIPHRTNEDPQPTSRKKKRRRLTLKRKRQLPPKARAARSKLRARR